MTTTLQRPGEPDGPCLDDGCQHERCHAIMRTAAEICGACGYILGFGRQLVSTTAGPLGHRDCVASWELA